MEAERHAVAVARDLIADEMPRRLRAERERQGISVRELARRLALSPSAISQIETGRARPSVSTLYAIVTELGLSLDVLFAQDARRAAPKEEADTADSSRGRSPHVTSESRQGIQLGTGVRWERLTAAPDPKVDFLFVTYEVDGSSSPDEHLMRHAGFEYGIVLSGELELTVGFDTYLLKPGDSISFDSAIPHRLRTVGDQPATGVWVVIGRDADPRNEPSL
jgi:transcriptional regulator with XRE-family HTH domain